MGVVKAKRIMIAAPKSGSGKTTITCAVLETFVKRGLDPVAYKCGPDYIDPLFHERVLGVQSRNLDTYFAGCGGVRDIIAGCDDGYAVIEGVMGVFDGVRVSGIEGSCYEIAKETATPMVLVVDASGVGRTIISIVKGILTDDKDRLIKGVILNRISEKFYKDLAPVMESELGIKVLGFFPKDPSIVIGSRHLGLMLPQEISQIREKIGTAADLLEKNVDIDELIRIMESAPETGEPGKKEFHVKTDRPLKLAVAYDDAFCFYYRENLEMVEKYGVETALFSPLEDKTLPEGANGILLGGGYPENHLEKLSGNTAMLRSIKEAIDSGIPSLAECGGFMYLHRSISDQEGKNFDMVGAVDGTCFYSGHLVRFGYMQIMSALDDTASDEMSRSLVGMRGHEFHYYDSTCTLFSHTAKKPYGDLTWDCMVCRGNGIWGFPHFYYGSSPEFIECFVKRMKEVSVG